MPSHRERDVRVAIHDLLDSTGAFDRVYLGTHPDVDCGPSGLSRTASIEPSGTVLAAQGDDVDGGIKATATVTIILLARDDDPTARDDAVEMLLNTTAAALNGRSLGGVSLPGSTRLRSWAWRKAAAPERRIEATLEFLYLVEGWDRFDLSE
jgi:hypothetical protein